LRDECLNVETFFDHYDNNESGIIVVNDGQGPAIFHGTILRIDD